MRRHDLMFVAIAVAMACGKKDDKDKATSSGSASEAVSSGSAGASGNVASTSPPRDANLPTDGPTQAAEACTFPTQMAATPEETAWRLLVAATCPINKDRYPFVAWEQWIEQNQLYSTGQLVALKEGERPRFHASPLALMMKKKNLSIAIAAQDCGTAASGRTICEEVRLNGDAQVYISSNGLAKRSGQVDFVKAGKGFVFNRPAIEIKADWIRLDSCSSPPSDVHVETVGNACYALGGIHLISKLTDNWVWATFEAKNKVTNPQRCVALGCSDQWGAVPAQVPAGPNPPDSQLSSALLALMTQANLSEEWRNYRLDGVQMDFVKPDGSPTLLGNSLIEGENVGADLKTSSCITCHDNSAIDAKGGHSSASFVVGKPKDLPAGFVRRDFVWSLELAK